MTKNEFMTYVSYLNKLFKFEMPDKEVLPAWYKPFENTHLHIAKKMADMYFQDEQGRFKLSKLIEYKSRAMSGVTFKEPINECTFCRNTGYIQVEIPYRNTYTTTCKRCLCSSGESLPKYIRQITREELQSIDKNGMVIKDFSLHHMNDEESMSIDNYFESVKENAI